MKTSCLCVLLVVIVAVTAHPLYHAATHPVTQDIVDAVRGSSASWEALEVTRLLTLVLTLDSNSTPGERKPVCTVGAKRNSAAHGNYHRRGCNTSFEGPAAAVPRGAATRQLRRTHSLPAMQTRHPKPKALWFLLGVRYS